MINAFETRDFSSIEMIGDKDLIKYETGKDRTKSGLYLPAVAHERKKISSSDVIKTGQGYLIHIFIKNDGLF